MLVFILNIFVGKRKFQGEISRGIYFFASIAIWLLYFVILFLLKNKGFNIATTYFFYAFVGILIVLIIDKLVVAVTRKIGRKTKKEQARLTAIQEQEARKELIAIAKEKYIVKEERFDKAILERKKQERIEEQETLEILIQEFEEKYVINKNPKIQTEESRKNNTQLQESAFLNALIEIAKRESTNSEVCYRIGLKYQLRKSWNASIEYYKLAIERNYGIREYYNHLAYNYLNAPYKNYKAALAVYKTSYNIDSTQIWIIDRICWLEKLLENEENIEI